MNIPFLTQKYFCPIQRRIIKNYRRNYYEWPIYFWQRARKILKSCAQKLGCKYAIGVGNANYAIEIFASMISQKVQKFNL